MFKYTIVFVFVKLSRVECLYEGDYCNADGQYGICRPLAQCPALDADVKRAGEPMPPYIHKRLEGLMCGVKDMKLMVCCLSASTSVKSYRVDPQETEYSIYNTRSHNYANEPARRMVADDDNGPKDIQNHPHLQLLPTQCGDMDGDRILGGQKTSLFEMPWMVILSYHSEHGKAYGCGGTLINERYVLTAAHCVSYSGSNIHLNGVILGEYDVTTDPDCAIFDGDRLCAPRVRNSSIEQVIAHPGFTYQTVVDDIALIRLAQPADFSLDSMTPICLPLTHALQTESLVDQNGIVLGWGITENGIQSSVLLKVDLTIVSKEECNDMYKADQGEIHITNKQICAGAVKGKGSCGGDSGGPLMYPGVLGSDVQYVQRGIVSFGPTECGITHHPGVYTNVAYYMDWILDHIRP